MPETSNIEAVQAYVGDVAAVVFVIWLVWSGIQIVRGDPDAGVRPLVWFMGTLFILGMVRVW